MGILIVDDSEDIRLLLESTLIGAGYSDLITAESALEAFNLLGLDNEGSNLKQDSDKSLQSKNPGIDLVLLDVAMPGIDGVEACRRIKKIDTFHDIPIIMVTAIDDIKLLEISFDAGSHDYITKPFNKVELLSRVRAALRLKKEIDIRKKHEEKLVKLTKALEVANRELKKLSFIDGLTGIANRRYLDEYLDEELRRAKRDSTTLSLILIDIDFFKLYNDKYGHLKGDECLNKVANRLKNTLIRPADMLARYGGEEFAAILPETDSPGAIHVADCLRLAVETSNIEHSASDISEYVTISLGVASTGPQDHLNIEEIIKSADEALYLAKKKGRNCVKANDPDVKRA